MKFSLVDEFDIDAAGYWTIFLDGDFNAHLYRELKVDRLLIEQEDDGSRFQRVVKYVPIRNLPDFLRPLITDTGYTEINHLEWKTGVMTVDVEPAIMKDLFSTRGDYIVEPLGDGQRCRREFRGEVTVRVPIIGGSVEAFIVAQLRDSFAVATRVTRRWIESRRPVS